MKKKLLLTVLAAGLVLPSTAALAAEYRVNLVDDNGTVLNVQKFATEAEATDVFGPLTFAAVNGLTDVFAVNVVADSEYEKHPAAPTVSKEAPATVIWVLFEGDKEATAFLVTDPTVLALVKAEGEDFVRGLKALSQEQGIGTGVIAKGKKLDLTADLGKKAEAGKKALPKTSAVK